MPQLHFARLFLLFALGGLAPLATETALAQTAPQGVVSLNLCADQLLLRLADREQIVSLSPLVRDPSLSFLVAEASGVPSNEGKGEAILFSRADLVLAGSFGQLARTALLRRQGLDVLELDPWRSLDHGREQIRLVAKRLGHPERGEALIAEIDAALARTRDIVPAKRSILPYYRRGWVPASNSLISELLIHMGFTLQQDTLGMKRGGVVRLESIVTSPPDYLLVHDDDAEAVDNGSALLVHRALLTAVPPDRRLVIAGRLAICGGPSTPALIDALAREIRAKVR
ncbi:ABC transporter substrate-binding protein [Microvirga terricola]|uniref:ABC transporter substrate-binding protein n=1 Tax=Microvirga terricola TaxID=2719797 RepID=A0ABX0VGH3_9HYPH|nr:ABC transporter substrate-binding protein [Microvirga terricola]NIX77865.1 ABC transporter substrate-binding protein [Microvirga terricola]